MDALSVLVQFYNSCDLNSLYRPIAENILKNIRQFPEKSSYDMAELCFTAPATLRKLINKLGYKSYSAFKSDIKWALDNYQMLYVYRPVVYGNMYTSTDMLLSYIGDLQRKIKDGIDVNYVHEVIKTMRQFPKIVIFSNVPSVQIQRLETDLILTNHEVTLYTDLHDYSEQIERIDSDSFAIFIRPEIPAAYKIREMAKIIKARGATTLLINNSKYASADKLFDYSLTFEGSSSLIDMFAIDIIVATLASVHQDSLLAEQIPQSTP